nr:unnamed protein product [Digitaria exilis]
MGYGMQYPAGVGMQAYAQAVFPQPSYQQPAYPQQAYPQPQPVKASNPFDLGNDPAPVQAHMPLSGPPGASVGAAPQTLLGTSSFGVPPQQPHQFYQSAAPPSHFMMQQAPSSMPQQPPNSMHAMQQGLGSFNMGFDQQPPRYPQPSTPPSYGSVGGSNPFG